MDAGNDTAIQTGRDAAIQRDRDAAVQRDRDAAGQRDRRRRIVGLVMAGLCAVVFAVATGFSAYRYTQGLIADRLWVEQNSDVTASLLTETQRLDRVEFYSRLFLATHERAYTASASMAAVNFQSMADHVGKIVEGNGNRDQQRGAQRLMACTDPLSVAVGQMATQSEAVLPESEILECRHSIADFTDSQRTLLAAHGKSADAGLSHSFLINMLYLVIAIGIVIAILMYLVREAHRRGEAERRTQALNEQMAAVIEEYKQKVAESTVLTTAHDELQICATLEDAYAAATRYIAQAFPGTRGTLAMINNSRQMIERVSEWDAIGYAPTSVLEMFAPDSCCGLRAGRLRWRKPGVSEVQCAHFGDAPSEVYFCKPLAAQGETIGVLCLECMTAESAAVVEEKMPLLRSLTELASMAIASLQLKSKLQNQSIRDSLTSLFNRHFMEIALEREIHRAKRQQNHLAVLMLDVDHFKQFNDTYGHEAGDAVLREVAETFRKAARPEDIICRYGGEEFVMILPEIGGRSAYERAEMVRELVTQIRLRHIDEALREITISIGVAMHPEDGETADQLIRVADQRLYAAKRQGRNRVVHLDGVAV